MKNGLIDNGNEIKYTYEKLKEFVNGLSNEELKQPVLIGFEDCPVQEIIGHEIVREDIYQDKNDYEICGELNDFDALERDGLILSIPKGTIILF